ncbi:MAG: carboxypeptidase-like regulatory domain-containing protein, partial [Bacteroidales bacterium]|nr:carboxypeptidase-like regulatory domain-containing protein [Bacteroidales bacterium]
MKNLRDHRQEPAFFDRRRISALAARLLCCLTMGLNFALLNAQEIRITIHLENVSLGEILHEIKIQSGKNILYNNNKVDGYRNESVHIADATLEDALKECLKGKHLRYRIVENVIIIEPDEDTEGNRKSKKGLSQTIRGTVMDADTKIPLTGANIILLPSDPVIGTVTDAEGNFRLENVPVGRVDIEISFVGYESYSIKEIIVGSGKEVVLNITLKESLHELTEIQIRANSNKDRPINPMATLSAKQLSMEEANRYAGGIDDPARLVTSFAGVSSASVRSNGIVIRGNAPKGLLWRMEGIQIPNPSHFADFISLGGGAVTALSSQTMANSDFYTGAFPAEFGNAFSGVFDIQMRTGNAEKREHTFQAGLIGIDFASEGPFIKGKRASYLFNYRYSTLGLLAPILPKEMGILSYQDLSFKLNFPTRKLGTFSVWGIGAFDKQIHRAEKDSMQWTGSEDRKDYQAKFAMGAIGLSHKIILGEKTYVHSTIAPTGNIFQWIQERYDDDYVLVPKTNFNDSKWKYTFTSFISHKFNAVHANKTGLIIDRLHYDVLDKEAVEYGEEMITFISGKGSGNLIHGFSQSKLRFGKSFTVNAGIHAQWFTLNDHYTVEPRIGISWNLNARHTVSFAYGLHSQLENISLYLAIQENSSGDIMPNKNLDFAKAHHFVMGYAVKCSDYMTLKVEPFYQKLFNIPVVPGSYISGINLDDIWSFNDSLVNEGTGKNAGIDITLERYLNKGFYYMATASLFRSSYKGGDGIERSTRFNR